MSLSTSLTIGIPVENHAGGGTPQRLTKFEGGRHTTHRWPTFLPDGKHFLFFGTNHSGGSEAGIYYGSLAGR